MKWLKRLTWVLLPIVVFAIYVFWPFIFAKDPNELVNITLKDGALERQFRIKRGNFTDWQRIDEKPIANGYIRLDVGFPDMGLPPPWKQREQYKRVFIIIDIVPDGKPTLGEQLIKMDKEFPAKLDDSPGRARFVEQRSGYDIYESRPDPKTGVVDRVLIFKDRDGRLTSVSDTFHSSEDRTQQKFVGRIQTRILDNLDVQFSVTDQHGLTPREMRNWVENYIRQIVVPPPPALSPN